MYEEYLEAAVAMAREAGAIQLRGFRSGDLGVETKSNLYDVVTRIDKECEALIARRIAERFPDHSLLGEEGGERGAAGSEWRWVVDPLDGTTNYSQGLPVFAVSIALQHRGQTVVGVIYAPWLDELYTAVKGGGARLVQRGAEPRTLRVGCKSDLGTAVLATGFPYDKASNADNNLDNVTRTLTRIRGLRRMGSAAYDLCCVAAGWIDGYWELALHEWDVCAGELIVSEAGGRVEPLRTDRGVSIIAGNPELIAAMRQYIR